MPPKKKFNRIDVLDFVSAPVGNWADDEVTMKPMGQNPWDAAAPSVGTLDILNATRASIPLPTSPPYTARVSNLTFEMTETELRKYLSDQGLSIKSLRCPKDAATGRSRGSAFVEFDTQKDLAAAVKLDGQSIHNRPIRVSVAESRMHDNRYESGADWSAPRRGPLDPTERMGGSRFGGASDGPLNWGSRREPTGSEQAPRAPGPRPDLGRFYMKEGEQGNFGGPGLGRGGPRNFDDRHSAPALDWGQRKPQELPHGAEERSFRREHREPREPREPRGPPATLNWAARREVQPPAPRPAPREHRAPAAAPVLDWTSGHSLPAKTASSETKSRNAAPAPAANSGSNSKSAPKGHGFEVLGDA